MALSPIMQDAYALYKAGFRGQALVNQLAINGRESHYNPHAKNLTYPDHSIGEGQINQLAHHGRFGTDAQLEDPLVNARAQWKLSSGGRNLMPWKGPSGSWKDGITSAMFAAAKKAAAAVQGGGVAPTTGTVAPSSASPAQASPAQGPERAALIAQYLQTQHDPNSLISLATGLQAIKTAPTATAKTKQPTATAKPSGSASGTMPTSGDYPLARHGKIIGTPYAGTHTLGNWQSDNAVDIAVPVGTPMLAWRNGVVVKVDRHPQDGGRFAGDAITVRYDNGQEVFYKHGVSRVSVGQKVTNGTVLGTSGSANGVAHLHIGILKGNPLHKWGG